MMKKWIVGMFVICALVVSACTMRGVAPVPENTDDGDANRLQGEVVVFAAASLTDAFGEIGMNFEMAYPNSEVIFNFTGSQQLAQQLGQGAPADVFASANGRQMEVAVEAGRVVSGTQRTFVRNRLVVVYPAANPAGIATLQDLTQPGLKLVLAAAEVPVGAYSRDFLDKAAAMEAYGAAYREGVLANVVSYEENVRSVLSKVILGEADAGIVYTSDVFGEAATQVGQVEIPDELNTVASYPIAVVADSVNPDLAAKFMDYVLAEEGQRILAAYGFVPTIGTATGEAPTAMPLEVRGAVTSPTSLTTEDLRALPQTTVTATDRDGVVQEYTGVALAELLDQVGVVEDADTLVFIGGDGYQVEVALSDALADTDALIAFDENDSLHNIFPSMAPRTWVKGLIVLEIR